MGCPSFSLFAPSIFLRHSSNFCSFCSLVSWSLLGQPVVVGPEMVVVLGPFVEFVFGVLVGFGLVVVDGLSVVLMVVAMFVMMVVRTWRLKEQKKN